MKRLKNKESKKAIAFSDEAHSVKCLKHIPIKCLKDALPITPCLSSVSNGQ
jgi:hypothetical protein